MTPEEVNELFGKSPDDWGDDEWNTTTPGAASARPVGKLLGAHQIPVPAKPVGKLNFTDESTTPDAEVRRARDAKVGETVRVPALGEVKIIQNSQTVIVAQDANGKRYPLDATTEAAQVIPPDAPANDPNASMPAKAKRGRKAKDPVREALLNAPIDDEPLSLSERASIDAARKELAEPGAIRWVPAGPSTIELGPESMAVLRAILAALTA